MQEQTGAPAESPRRPQFSSGPCVKFPGWSASSVAERAFLGRSHRAKRPRDQIREVIQKTRTLLGVPDDFRIGIVPASNTGALEMAMWNLLGPRPVDVLVWEYFGSLWARDARDELALSDCRILETPFGELPDLSAVRKEADIVFVWNGTTSGARCPHARWIPANRKGLSLCDATSAAFAQNLDWDRLDVATFSWQKALGGEGAHGVLIVGPRAAERMRAEPPVRGLPRVFRLVRRNGEILEDVFDGATLNTPSMLCMADCLLALDWVDSIGGLPAMMARADRNFTALQAWMDSSEWAENLVRDPAIRSNTSVCIRIHEPWFEDLDREGQRRVLARMAGLLEERDVALDIVNHRGAPPTLRIWCGGTVDAEDIAALTPWLDWAHGLVRREESD